jgi:hypothetical protein
MRIYLSIDLDYWVTYLGARRFLSRVFALGLPVRVVELHDELLLHEHIGQHQVVRFIEGHRGVKMNEDERQEQFSILQEQLQDQEIDAEYYERRVEELDPYGHGYGTDP